MEEKLELCGMYFRRNPTGKKWESICFSDLPDSEKIEIMEKASPEFLDGIVSRLTEVYVEMLALVDGSIKEEKAPDQKKLGIILLNQQMRNFAKAYGITKHEEEREDE